MQIIHFCPSFSFSGLEHYALDLAKWQHKNTAAQIYFVAAPGSRLEEECRAAGINVLIYTDPLKLLMSILALPQSPMIFHLHATGELYHAFLPAMVTRLKKKAPLKTVLQFHLWISHRKKDLFHKALYSFIDEVWCSSDSARRSLENLLPVAPQKIRVIRYGRDIEKLSSSLLPREMARTELNIPQNADAFVVLASFHPGKGQKEALDAVEPLLAQNPNLNLYYIGNARPKDEEAQKYEKEIQKRVQKSELLKQRIHFFGAIENAARFLKAFDVFVLPSYLECFSLAMLDAQLAGLPLIGTAAGGTPDVVIDGKTGWLAEPENVFSLRRAMERSLNERAHWNSFGMTAAARVPEEFSREKIFKTILSDYDRMLNL